jgi:hypothetical protein
MLFVFYSAKIISLEIKQCQFLVAQSFLSGAKTHISLLHHFLSPSASGRILATVIGL